MTSKMHVHDNSVSERRLRTIYEWLDSGNNKKALHECDKVLKKTPNLQCAKALRALSLLRMGKEEECSNILQSLVLENPAEDATLQAITSCYRELQQQEKICALYENAVKLDITNEEFHTHLFMSYVRVGDFPSQQRTALNLFKLKPKNPYYCWAVMSVIQQATRGQGKTDVVKSKILLSLAERMILKLLSENKLEAEQEVQLYLMILEHQKKFDDALRVFNGPLGEKLLCTTPGMYKLNYLIKLEQWTEVNLLCKDILSENMDHWNIWKDYVNSVFKLMAHKSQLLNHVENHCTESELTQSVDDTPEKAHEFICGLVENSIDTGFQLRGPYLARFELCLKLTEEGINSVDLLGETTELFIEYFRKFGHKSCCISDLRGYLNLLDNEKKAELSSRLIKDVGISSTSVPQSQQQMQKHLCSLQLSRLCGSHRNLGIDHLAALVTAFSLHYEHGYQTYGLNLLSTDQGPSDNYAILAAHVLYDMAQLTNNSKPIITALVLLESLLKNSLHNFNAKLLCVRLYHLLGAGIGANLMYESLDVKHLQLDSLGYIHCARLPTTGLLTITSNLLDLTLKFFLSNYKDSADHLTFCYKFGSFIKLDDFMDFREKLNNSFHYTMCAVDRILLNTVQCMSIDTLYNSNILPKDNKIDWENICDNHDLSVYMSWDPERVVCPPEQYQETVQYFTQNVQYLKLRVQILIALSTSVDLIKSQNDRINLVQTLGKNLQDWEVLHTEINSTKCVPIVRDFINLPLPTRLDSYLRLPYFEVVGQLFRIFICAVNDDTEKLIATITNGKNKLKDMVEYVEQIIREQNSAEDCYWTRRVAMEEVTNAIEIIAISALLVVLCSDLVKLMQSPKRKNSKKKIDSGLKLILVDFNGTLKEYINKMDVCLDDWKSLQEYDIADQLAILNLNTDGQNNVLENIKNSHITAVKELKGVLKNKIKLLNTIGS